MLLEYKMPGLTCNDHIILLKDKYKINKIAYTARLDPMASGIVPILLGDECMKLNTHISSNKIYRVKVILGIKTDSDDPLGIITYLDIPLDIPSYIETFIRMNHTIFELNNISINQKYHYFSTVALKNRKRGIYESKSHNVFLYKSSIIKWGYLHFPEWKEEIITTINLVDKNKVNLNRFRQKEIIQQWKDINIDRIPYFELELNVSSGFFVRQFIADFSMNLMCYDITRIDVY